MCKLSYVWLKGLISCLGACVLSCVACLVLHCLGLYVLLMSCLLCLLVLLKAFKRRLERV